MSDDLVERAAKHVAALNGHSDDWERYMEEAKDYVNFVRAERDALREALAFYAQHSVYTTNTVYMGGEHVETAIERDGGNRARAALKGDDRD